MSGRVVIIVIAIIVIIAGIAIGFNFFQDTTGPAEKTLTINQDGQFEPKTLEVSNDEVVIIKNDDDQTHTVKREENGDIIAVLDVGESSQGLEFEDDSENNLILAAQPEEKARVVLGSAGEEEGGETPTPPEEENGETPQEQTNGQEAPLPNTGPEDFFVFPVIAVIGAALYKLFKFN